MGVYIDAFYKQWEEGLTSHPNIKRGWYPPCQRAVSARCGMVLAWCTNDASRHKIFVACMLLWQGWCQVRWYWDCISKYSTSLTVLYRGAHGLTILYVGTASSRLARPLQSHEPCQLDYIICACRGHLPSPRLTLA